MRISHIKTVAVYVSGLNRKKPRNEADGVMDVNVRDYLGREHPNVHTHFCQLRLVGQEWFWHTPVTHRAT